VCERVHLYVRVGARGHAGIHTHVRCACVVSVCVDVSFCIDRSSVPTSN
jgi:hypothetical protein